MNLSTYFKLVDILTQTTLMDTVPFGRKLRHYKRALTCLAWLRSTKKTTSLSYICTRLLCVSKQPATLLIRVRAPEESTSRLLRGGPEEPSARGTSLCVRVRGPKETSCVRRGLIGIPKE